MGTQTQRGETVNSRTPCDGPGMASTKGSGVDTSPAVADAGVVLAETAPRPSVDESSPDGATVALLMSLFGARADVYATRWENTSTGKAGWSPARRGGWSRSHRRQEYLPLTAEVLTAHLEGRANIGG
jgi:hypothetical protein